jgi:hypothetical protein
MFNGQKSEGLKRELATERLEKVVARIRALYTNEELEQALGIPQEKADAFIYFAAEDETLVKAFTGNNTEQARLQMAVLSQQYQSLQQDASRQPSPKERE